MKKTIMRTLAFISMTLIIGFTSCSSDDDEDVDTCTAYANSYEKKFDALSETDIEGALALLEEFIENLPEGCDDEIDIN